MTKLGLNVSHYVYGGMWTSNITRARNMTPRMVYEELTTNWSPNLLASMSLTTGDEWIGLNPMRDKEQWDEFFTESELRHTGKCLTLNIPERYTPISIHLSCRNQCELHLHKKNQRMYQEGVVRYKVTRDQDYAPLAHALRLNYRVVNSLNNGERTDVILCCIISFTFILMKATFEITFCHLKNEIFPSKAQGLSASVLVFKKFYVTKIIVSFQTLRGRIL